MDCCTEPSRLHRLLESIPWNRFLGSLNVYKLGLSWRTLEGRARVICGSESVKRGTGMLGKHLSLQMSLHKPAALSKREVQVRHTRNHYFSLILSTNWSSLLID
jgi:hypothetical protein